MADAISIQELIDARTDAKTLEEAVNGDAVTTVLSRLGETYPTLSNALNQIDSKLDSADAQIKQGITDLFQSGGLPATPFATKALMTASALVDGDYAMVTDDTVNNGLYIKTAGAWVKSTYDPLTQAKTYADTNKADTLLRVQNVFATKALMTESALVDGSNAQVNNDTTADNNGFYRKTAGNWVNSRYDPVAEAHTTSEGQLYFNTMFFHDIRFEKSNARVWVQVNTFPSNTPISRESGASPILFRRGYKDLSISADALLDAIEAAGKVLEPSPSGRLQNCFRIETHEMLLFSPELKQFKIVMRNVLPLTTTGKDDWTIMIANNYGDLGSGLFGGYNQAKLVSGELENVRDTAPMGVIDIWCYQPYYEFITGSTAPFYFKPTALGATNTIFCFDARFGRVWFSVDQVYAAIRDYCTRTNKPESDFIMTSPKGVVDCIKFYNQYTLFYSIKSKNLYFAPRFDKDPEKLDVNNPSVKIIASDGLIWGVCEERVNLLKSYTLQKLSELETSSSVAASDLDGIRGIAHRGYLVEAPENTLPAYILAKKKGFDYVECDILFTSDNVPVLLHDGTVDRTSNGTGAINSLTLDQVKALDFGSWKNAKYTGTQIPTLEEFLNLCRVLELHPYLEMKAMTDTQALAVAEAVDKCQMNGRVSFISFTYSALQIIASVKPTARLGVLTSATGAAVIDNVDALRTGSNQVFLDLQGKGVTQEFLDTITFAAAKQIPVEMWTINDATAAVQYIEAGATGITTDSLNIRELISNKYLLTEI